MNKLAGLVSCTVFLALSGCAGSGTTTLEDSVAQGPDTGLRAFSAATYAPGQPMVVSVSVVPDNTSVAYALEDAVPTGWTVSNISDSGVYDAVTKKVKWGIFFNQCPLYFTYTVTPPVGAVGAGAFAGTLSVDGNDYPVGGQSSIGP